MKVSVVVGNPKPQSRTLDAAHAVALAVSGDAAEQTVDVITLGAGLLGWGDGAVADAVARVRQSDLLVVASPTFKATYSGVLKLFLDQFDGGEGLRDVVAIPVMLGAGPAHAMAPDLLLKPVLTELGASCPAPGLYLTDSTYREDGHIGEYARRWGATLVHAAARGGTV